MTNVNTVSLSDVTSMSTLSDGAAVALAQFLDHRVPVQNIKPISTQELGETISAAGSINTRMSMYCAQHLPGFPNEIKKADIDNIKTGIRKHKHALDTLKDRDVTLVKVAEGRWVTMTEWQGIVKEANEAAAMANTAAAEAHAALLAKATRKGRGKGAQPQPEAPEPVKADLPEVEFFNLTGASAFQFTDTQLRAMKDLSFKSFIMARRDAVNGYTRVTFERFVGRARIDLIVASQQVALDNGGKQEKAPRPIRPCDVRIATTFWAVAKLVDDGGWDGVTTEMWADVEEYVWNKLNVKRPELDKKGQPVKKAS